MKLNENSMIRNKETKTIAGQKIAISNDVMPLLNLYSSCALK